jgi:hypothetical protein
MSFLRAATKTVSSHYKPHKQSRLEKNLKAFETEILIILQI